MTPLHIPTPLIDHPGMSTALVKQVHLKLENLQPSGSFKLRGIGLLCQRAAAKGVHRIVCPSGGNAGFAAAVAGVRLGIATTIVLPETTPASVAQKIRALGADVIVHGSTWDESNEQARRLCDQPGVLYVPPFDHADIWDGNATLIDEAVIQSQELRASFDVVVCAVGGGGLLCGVLQGLHRNGLAEVPVIAVETEGAAGLHASIAAGELITLPAITSIATTLGARRIAQAAFDWSRRHDIRSVTVTDAQAVDACLRFADDMRMLVEPACGAALAVGYHNLPVLASFHNPLFVVCGGIGVELDKLSGWKTRFGL
ncbi:MAG: pyridoxal-phosphate dependent enzyme [Herminiimonas sp.]|nr:pyridoxal-phosphate dependent enzyme [Herminiimonas sp.]